jgi:hypothetical protein
MQNLFWRKSVVIIAFKSYWSLLIVFIFRQTSYLRFAVTNVGQEILEDKKRVVDGGGTCFEKGGYYWGTCL